MTDAPLNLAGRLARTFIVSKLTGVIIMAIAALGAAAVMMTPREENPQILVPGAVVQVALPGASAAEVEELVVTPLEGILSEMTGVDHTYGVAQTGAGSVQVMFKVGQPKEESLVRLYDRVMANLGRLPSDVGSPQIKSVDADDVPIVTMTLASSHYDDYALKRLADRMAERLRSLENVSVVSVRGGRDREISIELDPERLQAFGVTLSQVSAAFASSNLSAPLQSMVNAGQVQAVRLHGFLTSVEDVRSQIVAIQGQRAIYVGDIAQVTDGPRTVVETLSRFAYGPADPHFAAGGEMPAVTLAVAKKKGANAVVVADAVQDRIARMKSSMLPADVDVVVTRDDGQKANDAVNTLIEHLGIAIATVSLVLVLFLGWREAIIVTVTIPLILFVTLAADLFGGVTINRVTLFALILSLGLLVDAAIVVIENIHRHYGSPQGGDKEAATVAATNEIGSATNLATLGVMLVFSSLFLVTGMAGQYFYPIAFNVPIAMAASVVVAYIVTPWAANRWLTRGDHASGDEHGSSPDALQRLYARLLTPLQTQFGARRAFAAVIAVAMSASVLQGAWQFVRPVGMTGPTPPLGVALGFLPKDNKNTFNIVVAMAETTAIEETDRLVRQIGGLLAEEPAVANWQSWLGQAGVADFNALLRGTADRQGSYVAEIRVNLVDRHSRSASSIEIVRDLRPKVDEVRARFPGARIQLVEDPPAMPVRATVLAEVHGPDPAGVKTMADDVYRAFADSYDMVDLSYSEPVDMPEHRIVPDKEKAALSQVSVAQIGQALQFVYGGAVISRVHSPGEKNTVPVRAFVPRRHEVDPIHLDRVFVANSTGQPVPVSELVKVVPSQADRPIQHKDNERVAFVGGDLSHSAPIYSVLDLDRRLDGIKAPDGRLLRTGNLTFKKQVPDVIDGYQLLWDGEMRITLDVYRDMLGALGVALAVIFLLLVAYYRSFVVPLIAMSAVPLGIIGILPGHWLVGSDFSATSIVGIIALSGVVIRNSLLIIDFIQDHLSQGVPLEEAVRQAGATRLRPILLTTLAIVLGSAVMVKDPVFGGLAISLIFGTVVSTALTVFVVPILFQLHGMRAAGRTPPLLATAPEDAGPQGLTL
ncbi:efflux RND transporter permease subunit [Rhodoplanes roseus]|uniref:Acriflavin resistance protein n=1 Tax=Rhodoplanes roseus TaxID=29409 RepID=A0A327L0S4_9BRAD|nr:efflux RND transporter permease subunit [Rhodoplanes roseus]RAI43864.1 acriflavin resistance protein [Rhodoplanes roseus]